MLLLVVACSEDSNIRTEEPQGNALHLSAVTRMQRHTLTPGQRTSTVFTAQDDCSIKMFITTKDVEWSVGQFNYKDNKWENDNLSVKEHTQYYIYGFMPNDKELVDESDLEKPDKKDFSAGANLILKSLPVFTEKDICVIVGVRRVTNNQTTTDAVEGNYSYLSGLASENYVNLLMAHLYCRLILQINVDKDYYALRHIKLKSVTLTSTYGDKINATVLHQADEGLGQNSVIYAKAEGSADNKVWEFLKETDESKVLPSNAENVVATPIGTINCAPCTFDVNGTYLSITCTYDVCDANDETKVLRANCTVTNKLKLSNMYSGVQRTVTLTVAPTYLYVLSDDDLNNPTIIVN